MSRFVVSIPGDELTTDASKKPWGHVNVFPLVADRERCRAEALRSSVTGSLTTSSKR